MQARATTLHLKLNHAETLEVLPTLVKFKKIFTDLKFHIAAENQLFKDYAPILKSGLIDSVAFGVTQTAFEEFKNNYEKSQSLRRIFYDNGEFIFRTLSQAKEPASTLLLLMPAWNNDFAPNGLAHIAGCLESIGEPCRVVDLNNFFWRKFRNDKNKWQSLHNVILWSNYSLYIPHTRPVLEFIFEEIKNHITPEIKHVGFSLFNTNTHPSHDAMKVIKKINPEIKIFAGGPNCSEGWAKTALADGSLDAAVFGEGEATARELIRLWSQNQTLNTPIAGAMININGVAVRGPERPLLKMEDLPLPDFSKFQIYTYDTVQLPIYSSRGCVAKCSFCSETIYWKKFRAQQPERIVNMMKSAIENFGMNRFQFNDSLMNGSHQLLEDMCDRITDENIKVEFIGYSRFDHKMTPTLIQKMAKAGCKGISFGFESGSQKVVDLMNKKVLVDNYDGILETAYKAGIENIVCIIIGFPGETWADFFSTVKKILKVGKYISRLNLSIMEISPDSLIAKDYAKYGIVNYQGRYWRTKNYTNFFLMRFARYTIFRLIWKYQSGRDVSIYNWSQGYIMFFKKLMMLIKQSIKRSKRSPSGALR